MTSHRSILALVLFGMFSATALAQRVEEAEHIRFVDPKGRTITRLIYAPMPVYPFNARLHQEGGEGLFRLRIEANGTVSAIEVHRSTGVEQLDIAAARALIRWRFTPPADGRMRVQVPVNFRMNSRITGGTILD
jgi:TonB family protein